MMLLVRVRLLREEERRRRREGGHTLCQTLPARNEREKRQVNFCIRELDCEGICLGRKVKGVKKKNKSVILVFSLIHYFLLTLFCASFSVYFCLSHYRSICGGMLHVYLYDYSIHLNTVLSHSISLSTNLSVHPSSLSLHILVSVAYFFTFSPTLLNIFIYSSYTIHLPIDLPTYALTLSSTYSLPVRSVSLLSRSPAIQYINILCSPFPPKLGTLFISVCYPSTP